MESSRAVRFFPRIRDIFFIAVFVSVLLLGNRMINLDGDLPRHLLTGKVVVENLKIPTTELFIYPYENQPNVSHELIAQIIFYLIYSFAGLPGLVLLAAILLSSTFIITYNYLTSRFSMPLSILILVAWGAFATSLSWAVRPHLFSMFFMAIWLIWTDRLRRGEEIPLWRFFALMVLWSNTHSEFIPGVLVIFAFAMGWLVDYFLAPQSADIRIGKRIWGGLLLSLVASVLNPGGLGSWSVIFNFVNDPYLMARMAEVNPPNFQAPDLRVLLLLMAFSVFMLAIKRDRLSSGQGFLLAGFTILSLMMFRNIHMYGIVAPFVLAETLVSLRSARVIDKMEQSLANMDSGIHGSYWSILASFLMIILVLRSPISSLLYTFDEKIFPVEAVQWLKVNPQKGHMFNDLNWGGYIELNLWPKQKAFVDSNSAFTQGYEDILTATGDWESYMKQNDIAWVIIGADSRLAMVLVNTKGWTILHQDDTAIVLAHP